MSTMQELGGFLAPITEVQYSLDEVRAPFNEAGYIHPIQCRWAIDDLEKLNRYIQNFCAFLNETEHLPIVFTALRYRPLLTLHRMQEQISTLIDSLENHLVACMAPSEQLLRQRKDIQEGFERLLQYISDMPQQVQFLVHEARFQEKKLIAVIEE
jgi:hypothetical protein